MSSPTVTAIYNGRSQLLWAIMSSMARSLNESIDLPFTEIAILSGMESGIIMPERFTASLSTERYSVSVGMHLIDGSDEPTQYFNMLLISNGSLP